MPYQFQSKHVIYRGKLLALESHRLVDENDRSQEREVVVHPGSVVICPILADGSVVLIRNRRWGASKTLVELPAGTLGKGEVPINCAGRELLEETGYLAGKMTPLLAFYTSPGILSEFMHGFVATELRAQKQALEEGEEIELLEVSFDDALRMIRFGEIIDAKTIAMLLAYDRFVRNDVASAPAAADEGPIAIDPE